MNSSSGRQFAQLPALTLTALLLTTAAYGDVRARSEVAGLVAAALVHSPRIAAASNDVRRAAADRAALGGFFDPALTAAAGFRQWRETIPDATRAAGIDQNTAGVHGGLEWAVRPGVYVSAGAGEHVLTDPGDDWEELYRSLVGAQVWIPLLRDRAFREWTELDRRAAAEWKTSAAGMEAVVEQLAHDIELTYVDLLQAEADLAEAGHARERAARLTGEAEQLVELNVQPEYQLYPARTELALRQEDVRSASNTVDRLRVRLGELIGVGSAVRPAAGAGDLIEWAAAENRYRPSATLDRAVAERGIYARALGEAEAAAAELARRGEALKDDLSLTAAATWRTEDEHYRVGSETLLADEEFGSEVALVWRRTWSRRRERAERNAAAATLAVRQEKLRELDLRIRAELETARCDRQAARTRYELLSSAVEDAGRALQAEEERFRLGQGRSRNVLDAQKDLTDTVRRRNAAAAALLRAQADLRYACGYVLEENETEAEAATEDHDGQAEDQGDPDAPFPETGG